MARIEYALHGECDRIEDVPMGAEIISIGGYEYIGRCEYCGYAILEGISDYILTEHNVTLHESCAKMLRKSETPDDPA
jgi:hypothetical protein